MMDKQKITEVYRKRAPSYNSAVQFSNIIGWRVNHYRIIAIENLNLKKGDTVVDLCCGTGLNFPYLYHAVGPEGKIVGVDLSDEMLKEAEKLVKGKRWKNFTLVQSDAAKYKFPKKINGIVTSYAITLIPEYDEIISRGAGSLVKGGRFVILDFKKPDGWSEWFSKLMLALLFTREAVKDYLNALTPEGRLIFTMHNPTEVYKMLSNYLELMEIKGIDGETAMRNVLIYSNGMMPVLVIKKAPFEKNETEIKHILAHQYNFDRETFFIPYIQQIEADTLVENKNYQWYMCDRLIYGISQNKQLSGAAVLNLKSVDDDSPYFFNYEGGIPKSLMTLFILSLIVMGWLIFRTVRGWKFRQELMPDTRKKH